MHLVHLIPHHHHFLIGEFLDDFHGLVEHFRLLGFVDAAAGQGEGLAVLPN